MHGDKIALTSNWSATASNVYEVFRSVSAGSRPVVRVGALRPVGTGRLIRSRSRRQTAHVFICSNATTKLSGRNRRMGKQLFGQIDGIAVQSNIVRGKLGEKRCQQFVWEWGGRVGWDTATGLHRERSRNGLVEAWSPVDSGSVPVGGNWIPAQSNSR